MTDAPNDLLEEQLENGYRAVNAREMWEYSRTNGTDYTPVLGHLGGDVLEIPDYDILDQKSFQNGETEPARPEGTHGTKVVAQAAAETGNGYGMAGMSDADVVVADIGPGNGWAETPFRVGEAIRWLVDHPAGVDVINFSWGLTAGYRTELYHAVRYALENGVLVVTIAHNQDTNDPRLKYPAQLDLPNVLTVAATNANTDQLAEFSNFGEWVDVAAPGKYLPGYTPDRLHEARNDNSGLKWELVYTQGTSFAAPMTAGLALRMCRVNPVLRGQPVVLKNLIVGTAQELDITGRKEDGAGAGRIDALAAVKAANDPIGYINGLGD